MPEAVTVVLVDDHPFIVEVLSTVIRTQPDLDLLGVCESGAEALERVPGLDPQVIVLDNLLRDTTGVEVVARLREAGVGGRVLLFSALLDRGLADEALAAGVDGCISKRSKPDAVCAAIRRVAAGEQVVELP